MRVAVIRVCQGGRKIQERDLANASPIVGDLHLVRLDYRRRGSFEVLRLQALDNPSETGRIADLFEPKLVILHSQGMVFRGFESVDRRGMLQEWRCSLLS